MTVKLGIMELPVTQDADRVRDYLNGTIADGGLWTALGRASDHDHTGGLNGKPIAVSSIPDGSITVGKLDPSVLLPYALVDGSKPFTGQVVANADLLVRDTLYFGAKPAGTGDANLKRTGANAFQFSGNVGVGVAPAAWGAGWRAIQIGTPGTTAVWADTTQTMYLMSNSYHDGSAFRAIGASLPATRAMVGADFQVGTAPAVAAGAAQTFTTRLTVEPGGDARFSAAAGSSSTITLDAAADQYKLVRFHTASVLRWQMGTAPSPAPPDEFHLYSFNDVGALTGDRLKVSRAGTVTLTPDAGANALVVSGSVIPSADGAYNLGLPSPNRWSTVYAAVGTIQTSHVSQKQDFALLDPAACAEAVLGTDWLSFEYKPPETPPSPPSEDADEETKRMFSAGVEANAMARKQKGFVLGSDEYHTADLFGQADRRSASPSSDLAVVACALQDALRRIAALEGAAA